MQARVAEYVGEHLLQVDLAASNRWRRGWLQSLAAGLAAGLVNI